MVTDLELVSRMPLRPPKVDMATNMGIIHAMYP